MPPTSGEPAQAVVEQVRTACERSGRPTADGEVLRALSGLDAGQLEEVRRVAERMPEGPLGPDALVDVARGVPVAVAAAREMSGYYALRAERDALASYARARAGERPPAAEPPAAEPPAAGAAPEAAQDAEAPEAPPEPPARETGGEAAPASQRAQELVTLFAYHRDAVRVAQELGVGLEELNERIEALGLRRRIHRLLESTTDIDLFSPEQVAARRGAPPTGPKVRRRAEKAPPPSEEPAPPPAAVPSGPAADTRPVNPHGTRIWRRQAPPGSEPERGGADGAAQPRREYVRERRKGPAAERKRAAAAAPAAAAPADERRPFSELQGAGGRLVLERLLAEEKANPRVLAQKLGERYRGPAERPLAESDLRSLLAHHGLAPLFHEREVANARFLLGFHQGARTKIANALQLTAPELAAYLGRLGLGEELERTRSERARIELGRRRLGDRIAQVLTRAPYLDDLGVLGVIDGEVREQVGALFTEHAAQARDAADLRERVRSQLGLEANPFAKLLRRYGMTGLAEQLKTP